MRKFFFFMVRGRVKYNTTATARARVKYNTTSNTGVHRDVSLTRARAFPTPTRKTETDRESP